MKGKFGRCGVSGHGQDCHVSREIQSTPASRTTEEANAMRQVFDEMLDNMEDLEPEYIKVIDDNFWDLV